MRTESAQCSAIAVASTPLHLLYLAEFVHQHKVDWLELLVLLKRPTDRPQLEQVLAELHCSEIHWVDATSRLANRYISVYELLTMGRLTLCRDHYDFGVFADYGRSILANLSCSRYYWLGDGTKIIYETSEAGTKSLSRHTLHRIADPVVRLLAAGRRMRLPEEPTLFTPFRLGLPNCEVNKFEWLRSRYRQLEEAVVHPDRVYFFGSYFSERDDTPLMLDEDYLDHLEQVLRHFDSLGIAFVYVPHRHESAEKLERIAGLDNTTVEHFRYPAELEFYKRGELPVHIASFFSTCLFHFHAMGLSKSITSFYIDFEPHNSAYKPVADEFYKSLEKELGENKIVRLEDAT